MLLKGKQPVAVCPALDVETMRVPSAWREALGEGRLVVLSPFTHGERRPTVEMAQERNRFVASMAHAALIAYASPGGKMETLAHEVLAMDKPLFTLNSAANTNLIALGARAITEDEIRQGTMAAYLGTAEIDESLAKVK